MKEERRERRGAHHRKTSLTPLERELEHGNSLCKGGLRGALACWHSGLRAVAQVRVCSSQTRNLSLSFFKLLVTTHGALNLERPRRPNSLQHAMIPATTRLASSLPLDLTLYRYRWQPFSGWCPGCFSLRRDGDLASQCLCHQSSGVGPFAL